MISLAQLRKLSKLRPLTAKEKAILCYWDYAGGRCTLSGSSSKLSDILLSFTNLFGKAELEALVLPMISEAQLKEFYSWTSLINLTIDYDHNSEIFINKFFSLLAERSLFFKTIQTKNMLCKFYSLTLDKDIYIQELNDEIANTLFMYYRMSIYVITHHLLLSNAFDLANDLFCTKSLAHLTHIRTNSSKDDSNTNYMDDLIRMFQEFDETILYDHFKYIKEKLAIAYLWGLLGEEKYRQQILKAVEDLFNIYYPIRPTPKTDGDSTFLEVKEFAHSNS